jgi:hypothetical protein
MPAQSVRIEEVFYKTGACAYRCHITYFTPEFLCLRPCYGCRLIKMASSIRAQLIHVTCKYVTLYKGMPDDSY